MTCCWSLNIDSQVGAFGEFAIKSSTDLDFNMIFLARSSFVFGSYICTAGDCDKFQGRLMEVSMDLFLSSKFLGSIRGPH